MENLKYLMAVCALILSSTFLSTPSHAGQLQSGTNCSAANLRQALALGLGSNQFGVQNNGRSPFFVVCPVDAPFTNPLSSFVLSANFPSGGGTMDCVFRAVSDEGEQIATAFRIQTDQTNFAGIVDLNVVNPVTHSNMTIVCPLQPGQRINYYISIDQAPEPQ